MDKARDGQRCRGDRYRGPALCYLSLHPSHLVLFIMNWKHTVFSTGPRWRREHGTYRQRERKPTQIPTPHSYYSGLLSQLLGKQQSPVFYFSDFIYLFFLIVCVCMGLCAWVQVPREARRGRWISWMAVGLSCRLWMLGSEPGSSTRAMPARNCWGIYLFSLLLHF